MEFYELIIDFKRVGFIGFENYSIDGNLDKRTNRYFNNLSLYVSDKLIYSFPGARYIDVFEDQHKIYIHNFE